MKEKQTIASKNSAPNFRKDKPNTDHHAGNVITMRGDSGEMYVFGGKAKNDISTGSGDDVIDAGGGDDVIRSGAGKDFIVGGPGNDVLDGGKDDDYLMGDEGDDCYYFSPGDGADDIYEIGGNDTALLDGFSKTKLRVRRVNDNLEISQAGSTDKITISQWFLGEKYQVENILCRDETATIYKLDITRIMPRLLQGMASFSPTADNQFGASDYFQPPLAIATTTPNFW